MPCRKMRIRVLLMRPGRSVARMISWKAVIALLFIMTMVLGTYLKYFDRPSGAETLMANRNLGKLDGVPSFFKKSGDSRNVVAHNDPEQLTDSSRSNRTYDMSEKNHKNQEQPGSRDEEDYSSEKDPSTNSSVDNVKTDNEAGLLRHGINDFDWDGWVEENDFVSIGSFWGYCDEEDPVEIGKILLFANSGRPSVTAVLNTTFDADILNGTAEGRIQLYDTQIYHKTYDLCELAAKYEDEFFICPIAAGEKYYIKEKPVSRFVLSGEYTVELTMRDGNGRAIICGWCKVKI